MKRILTAALLCSVALPAHAGMRTIKNAGYWSAVYMYPDGGHPFYSCSLVSRFPSTGAFVEVGVTNNDQVMRVAAGKTGWRLPSNVKPSVTVTFDDGANWTKPHNAFVPVFPGQTVGTGVALRVSPNSYAHFVHEFTAGHTMTVSFSGNEPPWTFNLWGVTALWDAFMSCAQGVAPQFAQTLIAQQQGNGYGYGYGGTAPYGPGDVPAPAPPQQTQPYGPADGGGGGYGPPAAAAPPPALQPAPGAPSAPGAPAAPNAPRNPGTATPIAAWSQR